MKNGILYLVCFNLFVFTPAVFAQSFKAQARVFVGTTGVTPGPLSSLLATESLKNMDKILHAGVEITYPLIPMLDVGLRYAKHGMVSDEISGSIATLYQADLDQDAMVAVARIPFLKTPIVKADVFGGYGGTNTTISIKTASLDGDYLKRDSGAWVAAPYSVYGASVAIGYNGFYLVVEAGVEKNNFTGFKRTGNLTNVVDSLNLDANYVTVGMLFDGVTATKK